MPVQMIISEVRSPGRDYSALDWAIQSLDASCWQCQESVWLVQTSLTSEQVCEHLMPHVATDDRFIITLLAGDWESLGYEGSCDDWPRTSP